VRARAWSAFLLLLSLLLAGCARRPDDATLAKLVFGMRPNAQMQPGQERTYQVGTVECCYVFEPLDVCVRWAVEPAGAGVSIEEDTGLLRVADDVADSSVYTVTADVGPGWSIVSGRLDVYRPEAQPLVGVWREEAQFPCDGGDLVTPEEIIGELVFWADGSFCVTWRGIEIYHDYCGVYQHSLTTGGLILQDMRGAYLPTDLDGDGTALVAADGALELHDLWLGSPEGATEVVRCGHRFRRLGG